MERRRDGPFASDQAEGHPPDGSQSHGEGPPLASESSANSSAFFVDLLIGLRAGGGRQRGAPFPSVAAPSVAAVAADPVPSDIAPVSMCVSTGVHISDDPFPPDSPECVGMRSDAPLQDSDEPVIRKSWNHIGHPLPTSRPLLTTFRLNERIK